MKREVAFFKDRRANGGKALLETLRALGMTDTQIKRALIEYQKTVQPNVPPTATDAEIDAATDEVIRRGEDELQRRGY